MVAQVCAFKPGQASNYGRREGVIFTIDGQTYAHILSTFFRRDRVGMGYLRDSLLVIVDCTNADDRLKKSLKGRLKNTMVLRRLDQGRGLHAIR